MSEFAHRLTLDRIRGGERIDLVADAEERAAVAKRLGLLALDRFVSPRPHCSGATTRA